MPEDDASVARRAMLDLLGDGFDELLWTLENECVWAQVREPRQEARRALTGLAAKGHIAFFRWAGDGVPAEPIPLDAGLALTATDIAWELGNEAVTVALSRDGYEAYLDMSFEPVPREDRMSPVTPARRAIQLAGQSLDALDRGDEATAALLREFAGDLLTLAERRYGHSTWRRSTRDARDFRPVLDSSRALVDLLGDSDSRPDVARERLRAADAAMAAWDRSPEREPEG